MADVDAAALPAAIVPDDAPDAPRGATREFPVPLRKFIAGLAGTPDEVWGLLMTLHHTGENHTMTEWRDLLTVQQQRKG